MGCFALAAATVAPASAQSVFINEIHYDNVGADTGEAIEVAGPAGTDLTGWSLVLYNGSGGAAYGTTALSGTIPNQQAGFGTLSFSYPANGLQNGSPDGIALVDGATVVQFLSYEGSFMAVGGPANGLISTDIGVSEPGSGAVGNSLQLGGTGSVASDFTWQSEQTNTFGSVNTGQTFDDGSGGDSAPTVASTTPANGAGGVGLGADITIDFSEAVSAVGSWFDIDCTASGNHSAVASGGPISYVLNPDLDFVPSEVCTVTIFASQVTDVDADDPPDNMAADYLFSFATVVDVELVINEIDYDQPGTDTSEFIEIRNNDTISVDLDDFSLLLINGSGGGAAVYSTIDLPAVVLGPGEYFVVCGDASQVLGCDLDVSPNTNLIQNGAPDAVALVLGGSIVDTVSYEGSVPGYTEGSGSGLEDASSSADANKSISRLPDGNDTDQNNLDFQFVCATPGAANTTNASNCPSVAPPRLVINEIDYDQPGSDAAEFIEIRNSGTGPADLTGVSLLLVNGSGGGAVVYNTIALPSITLGAGDYFVVCGDALNVLNCDLDASPNTNLIQNGSPDAVALVLGSLVLDTVSYEGNSGAPYTEGTGTSAADSNDAPDGFKGLSRVPNGSDTNDNDADFFLVCITPGGANTSLTVGCTPLAPALEIFQIQGSGPLSPYDGQTIQTQNNVVTAVGLDQFAMQTPSVRTDGDVDTSDGIVVFTGGAPTVAVGDLVTVTGEVQEFFGFTEFGFGSTVTLVGSGALPAAVAFDATVPSPDPSSPSCSIEFECYEGMLIEIANGTVTGPNQRFGTDPIAEVFITAAPARTFREPGIEFPGLSGLPVWDGNPEVFELDPDRLGLPNQIIPAGSAFAATGVLGFEFGGYELWPSSLTVAAAPLPVPVREKSVDEFTVGSLNVFRLFDDVDDPPSTNFQGSTRDDVVVSTAEYMRRLVKFSAYIRDVLRSPDILAVQEAEKLEVLEDLALMIATDDPGVVYSAYRIEGNDIGTIDVGFLVRDTVQVDAVTQLGLEETFIDPSDGSVDLLNDRPPLLLEARYLCDCDTSFDGNDGDSDSGSDAGSDSGSDSGSDHGGGSGGVGCTAAPGTPIKVIAIHSRSLSAVETARVQQKRLEQAEFVATEVQALQDADPDVRLVVIGDFNAYEFTDGYVDVTGHMKGDFDPTEELVCNTNACPDMVNPDLTDQVLNLPAEDRYSFNFSGDSQILDHALTSQGLAGLITGYEYGRGNSDAAVDLINDDSTPLRASDHDGLVLYLKTDCPRELKQWALESLSGVLPTGDPGDDERIGKAIDSIIDSLDSRLWIDGRHISSKKVFDEEKKAVKELQKVLDEDSDSDSGSGGGPLDPAVEEALAAVIDSLVEADSILAGTAITEAYEAANAAGCPATSTAKDCKNVWKEIVKAADRFAEALEEAAAGDFDRAIDEFKQAWEGAQKARSKLD